MAKIIRKTAHIFGASVPVPDVEQFGALRQTGVPNYTSDPAVIQSLSAWSTGWTAAQFDDVLAPSYLDRNAVDLVASYQLAYMLEMGIYEWDSATTYFTNSFVQSGGQVFISLQDNNLNNNPPVSASNAYWGFCAFPFPTQPTRTVYTSGSGTYTPPSGCVRLFIRMVGGGGGGGGNSTLNTCGISGSDPCANGFGGGNTIIYGAQANGGAGGTYSSAGGGGIALGSYSFVIYGGNGGLSYESQFEYGGGTGGMSAFKGGGWGSFYQPNIILATSAVANSGSGGGGGAPGGGGGAGAYVELSVLNPLSTSYVCGHGGTGGVGGGPTYSPGGNGAAGIIIIDEFYY